MLGPQSCASTSRLATSSFFSPSPPSPAKAQRSARRLVPTIQQKSGDASQSRLQEVVATPPGTKRTVKFRAVSKDVAMGTGRCIRRRLHPDGQGPQPN